MESASGVHYMNLNSAKINNTYIKSNFELYPKSTDIDILSKTANTKFNIDIKSDSTAPDSIIFSLKDNSQFFWEDSGEHVSQKSFFTVNNPSKSFQYKIEYEYLDKDEWYSYNIDSDTLIVCDNEFYITIKTYDGMFHNVPYLINYRKQYFNLIKNVSINNSNENRLSSFHLSQNYPNPFNPSTMINFQLPMTSEVNLSVYNMRGQKVTTLVNEHKKEGNHQVIWDASEYSSGIYFYKIEAGGFVEYKKCLLVK